MKCEEYNNICVLTPTGELSGPEAAAARTTVNELIDKKHLIDFVFDLEKTTFIDSEGLETLLWVKQKAENLFGQLKLANLDENCKKILEITRLEHRFECHTDLTGALKTMR